jgi:hypothetical protein
MFANSAALLAIEQCSALNQQCTDVVRSLSWIFGINNNYIRTPWGNQDKVRMRHLVIEFANGFDDH